MIFKKKSFSLFMLIGGINTLFGYLIFAVLIYLHFHYLIASTLAFMLGVVFNFFTTGKIVFDTLEMKLIGKFVGVYILLYLLNISFLRLNSHFIANMYVNGLLVVVIMAFISFVLNKHVVFQK